MENTLYSSDRVLICRVYSYFVEPKRGDIVVCKLDDESAKVMEMENIIKRVIGVPGDHVKIADGVVYVNDSLYVEDYVKTVTMGNIDVYMHENEYFILGDNRYDSIDSRYFGVITKNQIDGIAFARFYPFNQIKIFN